MHTVPATWGVQPASYMLMLQACTLHYHARRHQTPLQPGGPHMALAAAIALDAAAAIAASLAFGR